MCSEVMVRFANEACVLVHRLNGNTDPFRQTLESHITKLDAKVSVFALLEKCLILGSTFGRAALRATERNSTGESRAGQGKF